MSDHVRISATYRTEPDYEKLARALLLLLERQEEDSKQGREAAQPVRAFAPIRRSKSEAPEERSA